MVRYQKKVFETQEAIYVSTVRKVLIIIATCIRENNKSVSQVCFGTAQQANVSNTLTSKQTQELQREERPYIETR